LYFILTALSLAASNGGQLAVSSAAPDMIIVDVKADLVALGIHSANAAGEGATDDTEALQRAIDRVAGQGGGIVYVPSGCYRVRSLTVVDKVSLIGDGPEKTVFRALDTSWALVRMNGGIISGMSLYGTKSQGSGDNWKVGKGGVGKGGTATPVACIAVADAPNGAVIDNVSAFEARYDPLYVRNVRRLRVTNCRFDRAGRNIVSIVGTTEDFVFSNCHFGSLWGLYHVDIEQNAKNHVRDGLFINCLFDGSQAGNLGTDTWGAFLCYHGHEDLANRNIAVVNCEFRNIYVRILGVFPRARFIRNTFDNAGPAFVRVPSNKVGEFRDSEIRGNTFRRRGKPNEDIVAGVAFTGSTSFSGNTPLSANKVPVAPHAEK